MPPDVLKALEACLDDQSPARFFALRDALAACDAYAPYPIDAKPAYALLERGDHAGAERHLRSLMPNWLLSPGVHRLLSFALHKQGKVDAARMEFAMSDLMTGGILSTGDGTEARPFHVLHTTDEYDILEHLRKRPRRQSLMRRDGRAFDVQECEDGTTVWFDVTVPYGRLGASFGRPGIGP
jgi:hypothetical protein